MFFWNRFRRQTNAMKRTGIAQPIKNIGKNPLNPNIRINLERIRQKSETARMS
ncbi:hypothetical protein PAECIP111802_05275 [Paenibacillus allorhizosphaerae]|uniref:Uncharacterized protein n=1 Tax=Paenibacillus allorhizosphaerae TaxID=2849866 RepID=A0ABM8VPB3_9BACL|nr:hypothetical protein PAECIP111802_05275 [Paenibacillus allorhizosphaerae]